MRAAAEARCRYRPRPDSPLQDRFAQRGPPRRRLAAARVLAPASSSDQLIEAEVGREDQRFAAVECRMRPRPAPDQAIASTYLAQRRGIVAPRGRGGRAPPPDVCPPVESSHCGGTPRVAAQLKARPRRGGAAGVAGSGALRSDAYSPVVGLGSDRSLAGRSPPAGRGRATRARAGSSAPRRRRDGDRRPRGARASTARASLEPRCRQLRGRGRVSSRVAAS